MTVGSPIKSSSRAGRFKKKLVSAEALSAEAPLIHAKVAPFQNLLSSSKISPADFAACYILTYLNHRFPGTWPGNRKSSEKHPGLSWRELPFSFEPNVIKRLSDIDTVPEIFANFGLKSTPLPVNRALLGWADGRYGLELMFRIPTPREVLEQQKYGRRVVTAIIGHRMSSYVLGERDALSFLMHDLIHADHFYHDNDCYQGQLGFYGLLDSTFNYFDLTHEKFAAEFEYLIADMNAYPIHLLKCLKSAMTHYFSEDYFRGWLLPLDAPSALYTLNTPAYSPSEMDAIILQWLDSFRQS